MAFENGDGALIAVDDEINIPPLGGDGNNSSSAHFAAWHFDGNRAMTSLSRSAHVRRFWRTRVRIVALFSAQSFSGHSSINAAAYFPPAGGQVEVHIPALDNESSSFIEHSLARAREDDNSETERGRAAKKRPFSHRKLTEALFVIAAQGGLALFAALFAAGGSSTHFTFSSNAMILFRSAVGCNVSGFMCCLYAILLHNRKPGAARILTGVGCGSTVYGFIAVMGIVLLDDVMFWMVGVACIASFPAVAIFINKTDYVRFFCS